MARKKRKVIKIKKIPKADDDKLFAFLATFFTIVGFIIVIITKKKSEYVKFYAKQGLVIFIASLIIGVIGWIVVWIPVLGWIIKTGLSVVLFVIWLISWINALSGEMKQTPLIGEYARNIEW